MVRRAGPLVPREPGTAGHRRRNGLARTRPVRQHTARHRLDSRPRDTGSCLLSRTRASHSRLWPGDTPSQPGAAVEGEGASVWAPGQPSRALGVRMTLPTPAPGRRAPEASPGCAHLAVLTTGSVGCTLCPWPQLAGEGVTAGVCAVLWVSAQGGRASEQAGLRAHPAPPPGARSQKGAPAGREVGQG